MIGCYSTHIPARAASELGGGADVLPVVDTTELIHDPSDSSRRMRIDVGAVATGTVRVLMMPDYDVDLASAAHLTTGTLKHERGGLEADVSSFEGLPLISGGATVELKLNHAAAAAPTAGDDETAGYAVGSRWIDTDADREYVCLDAGEDAAVWIETTQGSGSAAPTNATFLVLSANATLTDERVLVAGTGISFEDNGPGAALTISATGGGGSGELGLIDGSNGEPSLFFTDDDDTGLYRSGSGIVAFTCDGLLALKVGSTELSSLVDVYLEEQLFVEAASAAEPAIAFAFDVDTGLYSAGTNSLGIAAGGAQVAGFAAASISSKVPHHMEKELVCVQQSSTPNAAAATRAQIYMRSTKLIVYYNDGSTDHWWYLDLTSAASQEWTYSASAP